MKKNINVQTLRLSPVEIQVKPEEILIGEEYVAPELTDYDSHHLTPRCFGESRRDGIRGNEVSIGNPVNSFPQ